VTPDDLVAVPVDPPLPEPKVEPYRRQVAHFAYYTLDADRGYGDFYEEILHACWCATASDVVKANEQGAWIITRADLAEKAQHLAMVMCANDYAGAPPLETQIAEAMPIVRDRRCGLLVMDEHDWTTVPANLPAGAILGFKVFRDSGQTIGQWMQHAFEVMVRVQTARFRSCWIVGADDRGHTLTELDISETLKTATELLAELGGLDLSTKDDAVPMVGAFSYGRVGEKDGRPTGGGRIHPNAWRWVRASAAASDPIDWADFRLTEEPDMPVTLPPVVTLRRKLGFVNIDPATGQARENASPGPDETFAPEVQPDKRIAFRHLASKQKGVTRYFSINSNNEIRSADAIGVDEVASVCSRRFAIFYNDYQGVPQVAGNFVICDEGGTPLPLR
jgi:hypothetical protein